MKYLSEIELKNLSFPDSDVLDMKLDLKNRRLELHVDSCYVQIDGGIRYFDCILTLKNWNTVKVEMYEVSNQKIKSLNPASADKLSDICEFIWGEKYIFKGFGKITGQWCEYIFCGGNLTVSYLK